MMPSAATPVEAAATVAALAAAFATKHLLADFVLQSNWMARGKEARAGWLQPLLAHVACHAAFALAILLAVAPRLWWLAAADAAVHFAIDRGKSVAARRGGWRVDQPQFWWLLGLDQYLHQCTNIALAAMVTLL